MGKLQCVFTAVTIVTMLYLPGIAHNPANLPGNACKTWLCAEGMPCRFFPSESACRHREDKTERDRCRVRSVKLKVLSAGFRPETIVVRTGDRVRLSVLSVDGLRDLGIEGYGIFARLKKGKPELIEFVADKPGRFSVICALDHGADASAVTARLIVE